MTVYPGPGVSVGTRPSRRYAGCASNDDNTQLWLLGGANSQLTGGITYADYYTISSDAWTTQTHNDQQTHGFDKENQADFSARMQMRCKASLYDPVIECPGGTTTTAAVNDQSVRYNYNEGTNSYSDLLFKVYSSGVERYEISNDGTNAADIMLVIGGYDASINSLNPRATQTVQYAVRYTTIPQPTEGPTKSPSAQPSMGPTDKPSQGPTCAGCTRDPTKVPTAAPVNVGDSGVGHICFVLSCIMAFISVIII